MPVEKTLESVKRETLIGMQPNPAVEVVSKMRHGEVPANDELRQVIARTEQTLEERKQAPDITPRGEQMIEHAEQFLHAAEQAINERNPDEHIQHVINADRGALGIRSETGISSGTRENVSSTLRQLGTTFIMMARSGEFRENLIELINVLDDIFVEQQGTSASSLVSDVAKGKTTTAEAKEQFKKAAITTKQLLDPDHPAHLTEEQSDALFNRLAAVMDVFASRPEWKQSILDVFAMIDELKEKATARIESIREPTEQQEQLRLEAKQAVQSFTGNRSIDPFLNSARNLIRRVSRDIYMRELFSDLRTWLDDVLSLPKLLQRKEYRQSGKDLIQRAKIYARDYQYNRDYKQLSAEARNLLDEIRNDDVINRLRESGALLWSDITFQGPDNQRMLSLSALAEMKDIIAPVLIDQLEHVPVPRIEGSDELYDYVIDNVIFSARDILPENISISTKTAAKIGIEGPGQRARGVVKVAIRHITTRIPNVKFFFKRKAFPRISDEGTVDVDVRGKGASLKIWLYLDSFSATPQFSAHSVQFILRGFDLHFRRDTKHTFLLNMGTKLFRAPLEKRIEAAVTVRIEHVMDRIALNLNQYLARVSMQTRQAVQGTPVGALLSAGAIPVGRKHPESALSAQRKSSLQQQQQQQQQGLGVKTLDTEEVTPHKTLAQMGYVAGTPGGAAILIDDIWMEKKRVLKSMGYKPGTPGGFAVPLDGDLYKWTNRSMWDKQERVGLTGLMSRSPDKLQTLKKMGYKVGAPGGAAQPLDGDIYQFTGGDGTMQQQPQQQRDDTRGGVREQWYIYGGQQGQHQQPPQYQQQQQFEGSRMVPGLSLEPTQQTTLEGKQQDEQLAGWQKQQQGAQELDEPFSPGTKHLSARDWVGGDRDLSADEFFDKYRTTGEWEQMPGGGLTSQTAGKQLGSQQLPRSQ